jgi:hypothetical protein
VKNVPSDLKIYIRKYIDFQLWLEGEKFSKELASDIVDALNDEVSSFDPIYGNKNLFNLDDNEKKALISWINTQVESKDSFNPGYPHNMIKGIGKLKSPREWGIEMRFITQ